MTSLRLPLSARFIVVCRGVVTHETDDANEARNHARWYGGQVMQRMEEPTPEPTPSPVLPACHDPRMGPPPPRGPWQDGMLA